MSAHLTDSRPHRSAFPDDLRDFDPRRPDPRNVQLENIDRVLSLVESVCGPDSVIAHMLTDQPRRRQVRSESTDLVPCDHCERLFGTSHARAVHSRVHKAVTK